MFAQFNHWRQEHHRQFGLAARIVVASLLTFILCHLLDRQQSQWAVITAIIVTQSSVGASLKASADRLIGTIGGAVWAVFITIFLPRGDLVALGMGLVAALAPLALISAINPAWRIAPITAVILVLTPSLESSGPVLAALQRLIEVGIGSVVAMAVSLVLFPARAQTELTDLAGDALKLLAKLLVRLQEGINQAGDHVAVTRLHHRIRKTIAEAEEVAEEALRERRALLVPAPDPLPICRTLRRLRNDITMIGRAFAGPLPDPPGTPLAQRAADAVTAIANYLRETGDAIARHQPPPDMGPTVEARAAYSKAMTCIRETGASRDWPDDVAWRTYGLAFNLEQLHHNLEDLANRTQEFVPNHRSGRKY
ncbi:MAG: FUSC family protein [Sphingomonadaceae bacterium]